VSKFDTGSLPLGGILPVKNKHHIFARTAFFDLTKLCMVVELVVPILNKRCEPFFDPVHSFSARGQNVDFWLLSKNNTGR